MSDQVGNPEDRFSHVGTQIFNRPLLENCFCICENKDVGNLQENDPDNLSFLYIVFTIPDFRQLLVVYSDLTAHVGFDLIENPNIRLSRDLSEIPT